VVATSLDDLQQKLRLVREHLGKTEDRQIQDPRGIYFAEEPLAREGQVAFLFPGQGSQYPDMLRDLAIQFPSIREQFELAERVLSEQLPKPLGAYVFPPSRFSDEEERASMQTLTQTNVVQPAIGAANMGVFHLLEELGVKPNMVAGHSYGEYAALCAGGVFDEEALYLLSEARGRFIIEESEKDLGKMAAVAAESNIIDETLESVEGVWIANLNSPEQTVISGAKAGIEEAVRHLQIKGIETRPLAVSCAFHSPIMAPARDRLRKFLSPLAFSEPQLEVYANTTGAPYPRDPKAIKALLGKHMIRSVKFVNGIEAMYHAGARIFIDVGPGRVLTNLTQQILGERPNLTVSLDVPGRSGLLHLHHVLAQLVAQGVPIQLDPLYRGRGVHQLHLDSLVEETRDQPLPTTTWLVDGGRAQPLHKTQSEQVSIGSMDQEKTSREPRVQPSEDATPKPAAVSPSAVAVPEGPPTFQTSETKRLSQEPTASMPNSPPQDRPHATKGSPDSPSSDSEANRVMLQYQQLMQRFLEAQQQVMLAYLRGLGERGATVPSEEFVSGKTSDAPIASSDMISSPERVVSPPELSPEQVAERPESPTIARSAELESGPSLKPTEPVSVEESQPVLDEEQFKVRLLQIVSERTGYPPDMLDLDLDLEADLGIDSIKRVEIVGVLRKTYPQLIQGQAQTALEELIKRKSLRGIIDWVNNTLNSQIKERTERTSSTQQEVVASQTPVEGVDDEAVRVPRFLLRAVDAPLDDRPLEIPRDSLFLITDDERGISQGLAEEIRRLGGRVALMQMGEAIREAGEGNYTMDLNDAVSVARSVELVRQQHGNITGVIHLSPLKDGAHFEEMTFDDWQIRLREDVKSLFYLAKAAGGDLNKAARAGGSWLVAATSMGHTLASDMGENGSSSPGHGGIAGLVKTIAQEWPGVHSKVVDLDPTAPQSTLISYLLREMASRDGEIEVGYRGSRRIVLRTEPSSLDKGSPLTLNMDSAWVVLVTGGARGIAAQVACELARRYRPTLLLVGRSPLPEANEFPETGGITSPAEVKKALMDQFRRSGKEVKLKQIESAYNRLCQDREMQRNIEAMQRAGARVQYFQADVRDEHVFGNLIDQIYRDYSRLDGVIHGAGIIEDKLLLDKSPDSFERVFDTKANSAFILSKKLRADSLKFLVFFSSASGCFGSRGQCDYAACNEVVNKLAVHLDKQWAGRIIAINWGPWDKEVGMVSIEIQKQFAERRIQLIPQAVGRRLLEEELRLGRKGHVEVVIGDGPWGPASLTFPLLEDVQLKRTNGGAAEVTRTLDPAYDLYLQDHVLDGKPVFPAAMAMEMMAEIAQHAWPQRIVVAIESLQVLQGIILDTGKKEIRVTARPQTDSINDNSSLHVDLEIGQQDGVGRPYYRARLLMEERPPDPPSFDADKFSNLQPFPMTVEEAYSNWLFQGPCFQGISTVEGMNETSVCAILKSIPPTRCLSRKPTGQWLIDPVVVDSSLQLVIMWERAHHGMTPLPVRICSYQIYGSLSNSAVRCYLEAESSDEGQLLKANLYYLDEANRMLGILEGLECSCSKALNRVTGVKQPYVPR
jgi:malonyl CoA-acyl carrier protein transacylase/NAD(P)-dependent dehydrogenase (short-subunit alcohol dehydrogenase family)